MNFSAGASYIDPRILDRLDTGIMQKSHRDPGGAVQNVLVEVQSRVRCLLSVPDNYHVLLMHGGAHAQFSAIPLNLKASKIGYVNTGQWSRKFAGEASKFCEVEEVAWSTTRFPYEEEWASGGSRIVHVCANETMSGIEMHHDPESQHTLVADFTSTLMSRPVDVSRYGVIYASAGKNLGTPGFCVVIVRRDIVAEVPDSVPSVLSWKVAAASLPIQNLYNTPPILPIQISNEVLGDYIANGGVAHYRERASRLSGLLYACVERSGGFYQNAVSACSRSHMNVVFDLYAPDLAEAFLAEAESRGMYQLRNHPMATGGVRVTVYNMIPDEYFDALVDFMEEFRGRHGGGASRAPIACV